MKPDEVLRSIESSAKKQGWPIIGPDRGAFLDEVVLKHRPQWVLEVGTLVGYSAIRIGRLLPPGGRITCLELNKDSAEVAASNIAKAGLKDGITILIGDANDVIPTLKGKLDMVFLDADKSEYLDYLKACEGMLHKGSVVVADNVKAFADEVADYLEYVRNSGKYTSAYREGPSRAGTSPADAVEISVRT